MANRQERARRQRDITQREAAVRHTLAQLEAGGKLKMCRQDGVPYIHIPPECRNSTAAVAAYLLSCLPETPAADDTTAAGGGG